MRRLVVAAALALIAATAAAEEDPARFPSKPVRLIVGYTAGGGNDFLARLVAQKAGESLRQPMVIENKPGAGAIIATEYVARAARDGYTLLVGASGAMVINPAVYETLNYDTRRDFVPISMLASFPLVLVVAPSQPMRSVDELLAYAKANPAKANYGSSSAAFQLVTELFKQKTGAPLELVPYKGSNEAVAATISGEVLMTIADAGPVAGPLKGGQLRGLAVTTAKRLPDFPGGPTMAEAGIADLEVGLWSGLFAPAGTPAPVLAKIEQAIVAAVQQPEVQERMRQLAIEPVGSDSATFARRIDAELLRWKAVAQAGNIKLER